MVKPRSGYPAPRRVPGKKNDSLLRYLVWLLVLAVGAYIAYSVWYTKQINPEQGLAVCVPAGKQKTFSYTSATGETVTETVGEKKETCFWSAHIHAQMDLTYCGRQLTIPKDKGRLRGPHTHKEPNKIHSAHSPQKVDPVTKQFLDPTPLTISGFLDAMEIDTTTPCPSASTSTAVVTVNGKTEPSGLNYLWQDGDEIRVVYN